MLSKLAQYWWLFLLRGLAAIIFGILALIWPQLTLLTLVLLFGAYALMDGIFAVIAGFVSMRTNERWWAVLLEGVVGILVGVLTFIWPGPTALVLLYFIAVWAVITGITEIVTAVRLRRVITNEWAMGLSGLASVIFGVLLFIFPGAGAVSLVWLIGAYSIIFGILLIVVGFRLRSQRREVDTTGASRADNPLT